MRHKPTHLERQLPEAIREFRDEDGVIPADLKRFEGRARLREMKAIL